MRTPFTIVCLATLVTSGYAARVAASDPPLLDAIRGDDLAAVTAAAVDPALTAADQDGTTPLMRAVLYARPAAIALLLDRGAAVNAANRFGATALMWAAPRTEIVRLLLARGADVNARASDGSTAVAVAARLGNIETMRALVAGGADLSSAVTRSHLLTAAYVAPRATAVRQYLSSRGVTLQSAGELQAPALARHTGDARVFEQLLHVGVDPRQEVPLITLSIPTFFIAARQGNLESLRALIRAGIDPTAPGPRGWTALMFAAADDTPSLDVMRELLAAGIDINARDGDGRTALDWALTRGETETSRFLRDAGAQTSAPPQVVTRTAAPYAPREALARAIARLQPAGPAFSNRMHCNSCHNQSLPAIAIEAGRSRGVAIDENLAAHAHDVTRQDWRARAETALLGYTDQAGFQSNVAFGLFDLAETGASPTALTDRMALGLASRQLDDGSWPRPADIRPPLTASTIVSTALALRGIKAFAPPGRRNEIMAQVNRAAAFLRTASPTDTQDKAFKLLGLVWAGGSADEIARERAALAALQSAGGGWAQMTSMSPDAYATGQALFALRAAGMHPGDQTYRKAVTFLLRTQLEDGTWFVPTRAFGFQPYFETGFPYGRSQFISTAATAWAATAIAYSLDGN
jgi:ankyrin repeat protein